MRGERLRERERGGREAAIISVLADWGIKDINQFQRQKTNCGLLYYNCSTVSVKDNK